MDTLNAHTLMRNKDYDAAAVTFMGPLLQGDDDFLQ
jgi:hypothetical protein